MASNLSILGSLPAPHTGSFRVRAPVTIDDDSSSSDIEYNSEDEVINFRKKTGSVARTSSNLEGDGLEYESGEEGLETASERHFEGDPDGGTREKSGLADKGGGFRPFVGGLSEERVGIRMPSLGVVEELRPIARMSMEDDEFHELVGDTDEGGVSEEEDVQIPGAVVKVPSYGVLARVDVVAPRVRFFSVDEDDEDGNFEEDEFPVQEDSSIVDQPELVSFAGEPVTDAMAGDLVQPSSEDVKCVVVETVEMIADTKHAIDDSAPGELKDYGICAPTHEGHVDSFVDSESVLDENVKLAADEVVQAWEPQLQECTVEDGGVKVPTDCSSSEAFTVDSDEASDVAETADEQQHKSLMSDKVREELIDEVSGFTEHLTAEVERSSNSSLNLEGERLANHEPTIDGQTALDVDELEDTNEDHEGEVVFEKSLVEAVLEAASSVQAAKPISTEAERFSGSSLNLEGERLAKHEPTVDGQTALDVYELEDTNEDHEGEVILDKSLVEALLEAASSVQAAKPISTLHKVVETVNDNLSEEDKEKMRKIQWIGVKFLRVVCRLGLHSKDSLVAQVLNRLALVAGGHTSDEFGLNSAENLAMELESRGKDDLDFSLNILVIGKTGVGKSATINSIFGEKKVIISPFGPGTSRVKEIIGMVNGVKIRVLDTPGLRSSMKEEAINRKILASIKSFTAKFAPDIVLYIDRLDNQARDLNDMPLLKSVSHYLTAKIWQNAVITLTHGTSPLPDGPTGSPLRFELLVAQRSHAIEHAISKAVDDPQLMHPSMMHPVSVVENNTSGLKDENGEVLLPNGQSWRTQLLLLCYSLKILSEASSAVKPRDTYAQKKYFGFRRRSLSLPHLVSSLLQSRRHPKLTGDQGGGDIDSDIEMMDLSDSDEEGDDDYGQLLPFKPLRKSQVERLSKEQRKAYFEEYDYRVKLFQGKQWKEEVRRLKEKKTKGQDHTSKSRDIAEDEVQEDGSPTSTPVPMPDLVLPPSFDGADPSFRYRGLEPSLLLARPVLDPQGWDHDCGYDGVSVENNLAIAGQFPCAFVLQVTKDKEEFNIHLDSSVCTKHGESGSSMAGFDIQSVGEELAYVLRGETKFRNFKMNKTSTGISITLLGDSIATGLKIEDQLVLGKRLVLVGSGGAVRSGADTACGATFEVRLRSKDFPVDQDQSTVGLSLMKWRGGLGVMATLQSQLSVGRGSKVAIHVGMNGRRSGQITVKTTSSDLHITLISVLPVILSIFRSTCLGSNSDN